MLDLVNVSASYLGEPVLKGIDLAVKKGEIVALLGESGSGKSTLLRVVAGLEPGYGGHILWDGASVDTVSVHNRQFGLMFQDYALFPHMTVGENIGFGLRMRGASVANRRERVQHLLALVGMEGYGDRRVDQLSGGERQRIALMRCLAPSPRLLLLDEPLGALDAQLRYRILREIETIVRDQALTTVFVTHDRQEAFAIADRVALLHAGALLAYATPEALYRSPATKIVAEYMGYQNITEIYANDGHQMLTDFGALPARADIVRREQVLVVPPSAVTITPASDQGIRGVVRKVRYLGDTCEYEVLPDGARRTLTLVISCTSTEPVQDGTLVSLIIYPGQYILLGG
jgi:thiamine transport system ATP-binding protein